MAKSEQSRLIEATTNNSWLQTHTDPVGNATFHVSGRLVIFDFLLSFLQDIVFLYAGI